MKKCRSTNFFQDDVLYFPLFDPSLLFAVLHISDWMSWREERRTEIEPVNMFVIGYSGMKTN